MPACLHPTRVFKPQFKRPEGLQNIHVSCLSLAMLQALRVSVGKLGILLLLLLSRLLTSACYVLCCAALLIAGAAGVS
jgi:hypothetical protein